MWPKAANPERLADGGDSSKTADWAQEELLVPNLYPAPNRHPKRGPRSASNWGCKSPGVCPPVSTVYLMAFKSQPPPNWCQAHKSGGPGVLAIGGGNRPGSVPGERRLFDGIRMTFVPVTLLWMFLVRSFASLAPWRETLFWRSLAGPRGSWGLTQRRKDRRRDEGLSPRFFEGGIDDCRAMIVDF